MRKRGLITQRSKVQILAPLPTPRVRRQKTPRPFQYLQLSTEVWAYRYGCVAVLVFIPCVYWGRLCFKFLVLFYV